MTSAARAVDNPRPDDAVDVSVIIVTYNGGEHIRRCLEALLGAGRPRASFEVVAVDNASEPSLVPLLREFLDEDSVVRLEENIGFARGCNLGADRARGRHVLLLNPDATVRPGTVDRLVEAADREPRAGVVGGRNMRPDGTNDPRSCGGLPSVWSAVCFATGLSTVLARTVFDPESLG
ncbi:MAG TPA: glycosyltransferase family 2 protein, partial [Actinotalea sp.]|nr:glycosyltransferase family 2 protein [Actinotalea sp.]